MAPPPGRMPRTEPRPVPRSTGPITRRKSSLVSHSPLTLLTITLRVCSCSRFRMISPSPNTPIASATKLSPSAISGRSKVKRGVPVSTSVPTRPKSRPRTIMVNALSSEPLASATEATRPKTISEKYSAGPNSSATLASGGANSARITVATEPAKNEPRAAVAKAWPALPFFAIW